MEAKRIVIWGSFRDYEECSPVLKAEEIKGNIHIAALVFLDEDVVKRVDGYPVVKVDELGAYDVDYIIGLEDEVFADMQRILNMLGISGEKLLAGRILKVPDFDFARYLCVRESKVSIISDNCWGGFTYHALNMPFYSPFINMFVKKGDFAKLAQNLTDYISLPLEAAGSAFEENLKKTYPVVRLGDVELHCNHYNNYEEAKSIWDKRKTRINQQNLFVKMTIETEEELEGFLRIPYRKIGFSSIPSSDKDVIDFSGLVGSAYFKQEYGNRFWEFVNWQASGAGSDLRYYDILKLLSGEEDYRRVIL